MSSLLLGNIVTSVANDATLEAKNEDFEDEESNADKDETKHLTTLVGNLEALVDAGAVTGLLGVSRWFLTSVAEVGDLDVGGCSNHHTNITSKHGGEGTNQEAESGVWEVWVWVVGLPWHVDGADKDTGEDETEEGEEGVLSEEERLGTL